MNIISHGHIEFVTGPWSDGYWAFEPGELMIFDKSGNALLVVTMLAQIWPPQ